ncbi:MAG: OmpA family protein [Desulfosarcina sp.]|nr:OmpA family protein [Desulfosarcina sp.]
MVDNAGQSAQWRFKPNADKGFAARFALAEEAKSAEEDAFLWSMADLMTLLLVFFVLLYANAIHRPETAVLEAEQAGAAVTSSAEARSDFSTKTPPTEPHQRAHSPLPAAGSASEPQIDYHPLRCSAALPLQAEHSPRLAAERVESTPTEPTDETVAPSPEPPAANLRSQAEGPVEPLNPAMIDGLKDSFSNDFYVRWDERRPVFVLGERITFNIGEAMLLADSQSALQRIADLIAPQRHYQIIVSGHTDDIAIHTQKFPSNWELSAARAASVAKFLASHGIAPQRLIIQGKSEFHPLAANTSDENRRTNRRVEISLIKGEGAADYF